MSDPAFDYRRLPVLERLKLVEDIWDSIAQEANADAAALPLTPAQNVELERRVQDADAHPDDSVPWETVRDELFPRGG
jgi:putative addiction module component (TIGR02574 family)